MISDGIPEALSVVIFIGILLVNLYFLAFWLKVMFNNSYSRVKLCLMKRFCPTRYRNQKKQILDNQNNLDLTDNDSSSIGKSKSGSDNGTIKVGDETKGKLLDDQESQRNMGTSRDAFSNRIKNKHDKIKNKKKTAQKSEDRRQEEEEEKHKSTSKKKLKSKSTNKKTTQVSKYTIDNQLPSSADAQGTNMDFPVTREDNSGKRRTNGSSKHKKKEKR